MKNNIILGCGTGRCGTMSLAKLLNGCKESNIEHERGTVLPWIIDSKKWISVYKEINKLEGKYVGNVSFFYLNYIKKAIEDLGAKVVILKRDKKKVVESFIDRGGGYNHFTQNKNTHKFDICFPKYEGLETRKAYEKYWIEYNKIAKELQEKYPENIKIFSVDKLNSKKGQDSIFDFCNIEKEDRVYLENTYHNTHLNQK